MIATGGICGGDLSKVRANWYAPWGAPPRVLLNGAHVYGDGAMHDAVARAGGNLTHLDKHWHYAAGVHHPAKRKPHDGLSLVPPRSALWLNAMGERIGPVPLVGSTDTRFLVESILRQPGQYSWQILNNTIAKKELAVSGCDYMTAFRYKRKLLMAKQLLFGNQELVDRLARECPEDIVTARSLAELVDRMNARNLDGLRTDLATVEQVVRDYDAQIDRGPAYFNDDQLRRLWNFRQYRGDRIRLCKFQKILDPGAMPLIAIREFILSRKSLGGIQTDLGCRVLRRRRLGDRRPLCRRRSGGLRRRRHPRHGLSGGNLPRKLRPHGTRRGPHDRGSVRMTKSIRIGAKRSGAWLVRHALEQLPVTHTFGIPGVHNTEIYDELSRSEKIQPVLVTHEAGAAFAADGISRTSGGTIGTLVIVPAAGITHAMSGIGEAFLDGIPMLVISGGIRTDVPFRYQLHELDHARDPEGPDEGVVAPEDARRDRARDLRGVPHGRDGRARPRLRRDPGEPAALPGDDRRAARLRAARAAGGARRRVSSTRRSTSSRRRGRPASSWGGARSTSRTTWRASPSASGRRSRRRCRAFRRFRRRIPSTRAWASRGRRCPPPRTRSRTATACSRSARASPRFRRAASAAWSPRT